jgi:uncharacterized protein (TIGR03790 family)
MTLAKSMLRCSLVISAMTISPAVFSLDATQLAVIINSNDSLSVQVGEYYAAQRRISFQNIIRVKLPTNRTELTPDEFGAIKHAVDSKTRSSIQAFALAWAIPYRVGCMSITSAFAFGYDPAFCEPGCKPTRPSPYFNSPSQRPFTHFGIRPAMAIAGLSFEQSKALIDRGVNADGSFPEGTAYLLSTSDETRNVRSSVYPLAKRVFAKEKIRVFALKRNDIKFVDDVLFYFTGLANVTHLETLGFVPGAIADHLTSSGGRLTESSGQMSALRWLEAGATGSYGTVVEPCNLLQKFPNPAVLASRYLKGETMIEAYWKSVAMPGQGLFIGEPLAAPFRTKKSD